MDPNQLKQAGFSDQEIGQYQSLQQAGFSDAEIQAHYAGGQGTETDPARMTFEQPSKWKTLGSPVVRGALQGTGMGLGAITGLPAGPGGSVAGAGLGLAAGTMIADYIDELTGLKKAPTFGERAVKTGKDVAEGAAGEMGGQVAGKVLTGAARLAGKGIQQAWGKATATGSNTIRDAIDSGLQTGITKHPFDSATAFDRGLRGEISGDEIVASFKDSVHTLVEKRSADYQSLLKQVSENKAPVDLEPIKAEATRKLKNFVKYTEEAPISGTPAKSFGELTVVPHPSGGGFAVKQANGELMRDARGAITFYRDKNIAQGTAEFIMKKAVTDAEKAASISENPVRKMARFNWSRTSVGDIKTSKDAKELKTIYQKIQDWGGQPGDNTAVELDRLKRDLDNHWSDSSRVRAFVADMSNTVKKAIVKEVPEYEKMTRGYAEATKLIKDIEAGLMTRKQGMSGRIVADQTLRRVISAMKDNFPLRRELVEILGKETGKDMTGMVSGYSMQALFPPGLSGSGPAILADVALIKYISPKFWPILAASSPRVSAEFLRMYGKALATFRGVGPTLGAAAARSAAGDRGPRKEKEPANAMAGEMPEQPNALSIQP
jgi:hypothetical protein